MLRWKLLIRLLCVLSRLCSKSYLLGSEEKVGSCMEVLGMVFRLLISVAVVSVLGLLVRLYQVLMLKPERLRSKLRKQGNRGPAPTILLGNIREIKKRLYPQPEPVKVLPLSRTTVTLSFPSWSTREKSTVRFTHPFIHDILTSCWFILISFNDPSDIV